MEKVKDLLKRSFELWVKKRWLKEIDNVVNSYNKNRDKLQRDTYVLAALIKEYNKHYPESLMQMKRINMERAKWQFWEGWMSNHDKRIDDATCSNCGYRHPKVCRTYGSNETEQDVLNKLFKFCPSCGKLMDKNNT